MTTRRLVISTHGYSLVLRGETITVLSSKQEIERVPLEELEEVIVMAYGNISVQAIYALSEHGIPIIFLQGTHYVSMLNPTLIGTVSTRREQYRAYESTKGFEIAKEIILAKISNQRALLGTLAKNREFSAQKIAEEILSRKEKILSAFQDLDNIKPEPIEKSRPHLMAVEAKCANIYWDSIKLLFQHVGFYARDHSAEDVLNASLNLGYAILAGECERGIHMAGLDPYGGFLHADKPGRKSLVFDIMEPFRPHVVDRTVFALISRKQLSTQHITPENGIYKLTNEAKKTVVSAILQRLDETVYWNGIRRSWSNTIAETCSSLAMFLRNQSPFSILKMRW
ncbi:MAG: CRISPR-associated endonuclease Cas1 [Candidatus Korarchaeota archaeon]